MKPLFQELPFPIDSHLADSKKKVRQVVSYSLDKPQVIHFSSRRLFTFEVKMKDIF